MGRGGVDPEKVDRKKPFNIGQSGVDAPVIILVNAKW
jgi:hypothetical protein